MARGGSHHAGRREGSGREAQAVCRGAMLLPVRDREHVVLPVLRLVLLVRPVQLRRRRHVVLHAVRLRVLVRGRRQLRLVRGRLGRCRGAYSGQVPARVARRRYYAVYTQGVAERAAVP